MLRPLRKALLGYSGIDSLSKFFIVVIREIPIRIPDPTAPTAADCVDGAVMQTILYGYVSPTTEGGKAYAYVRETVFQELFVALWTPINVDHVKDGLPTLAGVVDVWLCL